MYKKTDGRQRKMKTSFIAKLIVILCFICLAAGFVSMEKYKPYADDYIKGKSNKAAVIELNGIIAAGSESGFFENSASASSMLKSLAAAKDDNDISGIILKINSPGGTAAMSQSIYNKILDIRSKKPVVTVFEDVGASGAYYIASACDRIIAQEGSLTGSIGVIFSFMDYHSLLSDKLNINNVVIKSGKFKDIGSGTRAMTDEEHALMQEIINDSYSQFLKDIKKGRIQRTDKYTAKKSELSEKTLKLYADGRIFTGRQAEKLGFIDETGGMDTAKAMIEKMMNEKNKNQLPAVLIAYNKQNSFIDYLTGAAEYRFNGGSIKLTDIIPKSAVLNKRLLYLWE